MKQKQLERAREIEKEINEILEVMRNTILLPSKYFSDLKKELQEIKENWKDGCGNSYFDLKDGISKICGSFEDLKHSDNYMICPFCEKQNKEFKEICLEVGI